MTPAVRRGIGSIAVVVLCSCAEVRGQTLPAEPIVLAGGNVTVSGDMSITWAPDDPGFFNYTDYEHSTTRMFRGGLTAAVRAGERVTLLGGLRSENADSVRPYALYVRLRPWITRMVAIQAGRIPPTFGAFARHYGTDNPLIGHPIAYQYLTSLRWDSLPADADELLRMRGRGSRLSYSIGNTELEHGMAIASPSSWDAGIQLHAATRFVETTASLTAGTLSYPKLNDDNDGKRVAGRLAVRPTAGLVLGASVSRGPFVSRMAMRSALGEGGDDRYTQTAWAADVEYSRDYYLARVETIHSEWIIPMVRGSATHLRLHALATSIEGRYKIVPGLYAAVRLDHLGFSTITGSLGRETWDAPVTRVEIGGGYSLQRNLVAKLSYQHNTRDGGPVRTLGLFAGQLQFWF